MKERENSHKFLVLVPQKGYLWIYFYLNNLGKQKGKFYTIMESDNVVVLPISCLSPLSTKKKFCKGSI